MKKRLIGLSTIMLLFAFNLQAQEKTFLNGNVEFTDHPEDASLDLSKVKITEINSEKMINLLKQSKAKLKYVVIYSAGCGGTPDVLKNIQTLKDKYADNVSIFVVSSDKIKNVNDDKSILSKYGITDETYILDNSYGSPGDARKRGVKFRNELSKECVQDEIGVPYHLVFDNNLNLLFHGYPSFGRDKHPWDIVTYFMEGGK